MLAVAVALTAGVGAVARYMVDQLVQHRFEGPFPAGTLVVNASGSLLLGLVTGLAMHHGLGHSPSVVLGAGLTGGYTTFSTWMWESLALTESGAYAEAVGNVVGSLVVGLAAAAAGMGLGLL